MDGISDSKLICTSVEVERYQNSREFWGVAHKTKIYCGPGFDSQSKPWILDNG